MKLKLQIQDILLESKVIPIIKIRKIIALFDVRIADLPSMLLPL